MPIQERLKRFALRFMPERLLQNFKKIHYARSLRRSTEDAEPDLRVLRHLVRPNSRVVDLGANIGLYTKFLSSLVGPFGKVYSIEPVPQTFDLLTSNIDALGLINVKTYNVAISSRDGSVRMQVPRYLTGGENFYESHIVDEHGDSSLRLVEVPARTLDSMFGPEDRIEFVKCDVEGHERSCLRGATELLRSSRPAWLIEVSGNPDQRETAAAEVFAIMSSHGYEPFWFDGETLHRRQAGVRSVNYFFLTQAHVMRMPRELFDNGRGEMRRAA